MPFNLLEHTRLILAVLLTSVATVSACTHSNGRITSDQNLEKGLSHIATLNYQQAISFEDIFAHAKVLVETTTDTNLKDVTLNIVSDREIEKEVLKETGRLIRSQFTSPEFAEQYLKQTTNDQTGSYTALYVHHSKKVLVSKVLLDAYIESVSTADISLKNKSVLALFLHELVHAADDQRFGIQDNRELNFKASFVQSATFEGHAQLVSRNICIQHSCNEGMQSLENFMFEESPSTDPVVQSMQAVSRNVLEYSYIEGERFLSELLKQENGAELIRTIMMDPPDDPIQILVPETYPNIERDQRNTRLRKTLESINHLWNTPDWAFVETSTIKGIDVRNNPERRTSAIEGFAKLIDSMSAAQLFDQTSRTINPIDLMLIHTDDEATALLFAESFAQSSASVIESENDEVDITINNSPLGMIEPLSVDSTLNGQPIYTELLIRPKHALHLTSTSTEHYSVLLGMSGQYVIQISGKFSSGMEQASDFARQLITELAGPASLE